MFIDSSAVVAMIALEPEGPEFSAKIEAATRRLSAGHVILEASMTLSRILDVDPLEAEATVISLFEDIRIELVPIDMRVARAAVSAFSRFGKGRKNEAKLNFGDCLSYGCAVTHDARLLFKGKDFAATDIVRA